MYILILNFILLTLFIVINYTGCKSLKRFNEFKYEDDIEIMSSNNGKKLKPNDRKDSHKVCHKNSAKQEILERNRKNIRKVAYNILPYKDYEDNFFKDLSEVGENYKHKIRESIKSVNDDSNDYIIPNISGKLKNNHSKTEDIAYDYNQFKNDYFDYISYIETVTMKLNLTQNITKDEEEETDQVNAPWNDNIVTAFFGRLNIFFGKRCPKNIMYNINDITCIFFELRHVKARKDKTFLMKHIKKTVKFWFWVYVFIGIPLWITKGLCCCCPCKICHNPREYVSDVKIYAAQNPPGVYRNKDGSSIKYSPTEEERKRYDKLFKAIKSFY